MAPHFRSRKKAPPPRLSQVSPTPSNFEFEPDKGYLGRLKTPLTYLFPLLVGFYFFTIILSIFGLAVCGNHILGRSLPFCPNMDPETRPLPYSLPDIKTLGTIQSRLIEIQNISANAYADVTWIDKCRGSLTALQAFLSSDFDHPSKLSRSKYQEAFDDIGDRLYYAKRDMKFWNESFRRYITHTLEDNAYMASVLTDKLVQPNDKLNATFGNGSGGSHTPVGEMKIGFLHYLRRLRDRIYGDLLLGIVPRVSHAPGIPELQCPIIKNSAEDVVVFPKKHQLLCNHTLNAARHVLQSAHDRFNTTLPIIIDIDAKLQVLNQSEKKIERHERLMEVRLHGRDLSESGAYVLGAREWDELNIEVFVKDFENIWADLEDGIAKSKVIKLARANELQAGFWDSFPYKSYKTAFFKRIDDPDWMPPGRDDSNWGPIISYWEKMASFK